MPKHWYDSPTAALEALCGEKAAQEVNEAMQKIVTAEYHRGYEDGKRDAVVHAHWEKLEGFYGDTCTCCRKTSAPDSEYEFCPWCGAKMDEVVQDE